MATNHWINIRCCHPSLPKQRQRSCLIARKRQLAVPEPRFILNLPRLKKPLATNRCRGTCHRWIFRMAHQCATTISNHEWPTKILIFPKNPFFWRTMKSSVLPNRFASNSATQPLLIDWNCSIKSWLPMIGIERITFIIQRSRCWLDNSE